jgi:hypothetical protein
MKADRRISIKDYHRNKNLRKLLLWLPYPGWQFVVRMNGARWPASWGPVSLTRRMTAPRKSLVSADRQGQR